MSKLSHAPFTPLHPRPCPADRDRKKTIRAFQAKETDVLFVSRAASLGINLTSCRCMVLLEECWTPTHTAQVKARIERIGQTGICCFYTLLAGVQRNVYSLCISKNGTGRNIVDRDAVQPRDTGAPAQFFAPADDELPTRDELEGEILHNLCRDPNISPDILGVQDHTKNLHNDEARVVDQQAAIANYLAKNPIMTRAMKRSLGIDSQPDAQAVDKRQRL